MIARLRFLSLLPTFILFFFPWVEIQCQKEPMLTQTGIQIIYGGAEPHPEFSRWVKSDKEPTMDDRLGTGWFAGLALLSVTAAIVLAFLALRPAARHHGIRSEALAALALAALLIQLVIGFPAEQKIRDNLDPAKNGKTEQGFGAGMSRAVANGLATRVLPLYYVQMGLLGFPVLLLLNAGLARLQGKGSGAPGSAR